MKLRKNIAVFAMMFLISSLFSPFIASRTLAAINKVKVPAKSSVNQTKAVKKVSADEFTLIVSSDLKGYEGAKSNVLLKKKLKVDKNKNAMEYLRENAEVEEKGGFITEINKLHNQCPIPDSEKTEEQKKNNILGHDWFIYLNNKKTSVGANDIYFKKGDTIIFDIHDWDKREFQNPR